MGALFAFVLIYVIIRSIFYKTVPVFGFFVYEGFKDERCNEVWHLAVESIYLIIGDLYQKFETTLCSLCVFTKI